MIAEYTETVFECNTSLDIPSFRANGENMPMGYLDRLAALRKERGYTQETLAERLRVEQPTVQRWEKGKREPNLAQLIELAKTLGVSTDWLLGISSEIEDAYNPVIRRILFLAGIPDERADVIADTAREAVRLLLSLPDDGSPADLSRIAAQAAWQSKDAPRPN